MIKKQETYKFEDIEFRVIYSRRRTLGISVLPDSSVIVRVPYLTSYKTIARIVRQKYTWIIKHRDHYRNNIKGKLSNPYVNGATHLFRGIEHVLKVEKSATKYVHFLDGTIELGLTKPDDPKEIKLMLYKGYKKEATDILPQYYERMLIRPELNMFKPSGLIIRTMKRRWGSCSNKGIITLSTELIKLPDIYIEYVIVHEFCHLKHHNHGKMYYELLSELFPGWKQIRKEMRQYIQ